MKSILCLDLGTTSGWSYSRGDGMILSGSKNFSNLNFEGGGMRYFKFSTWLEGELLTNGVDVIYFE